jgi:hypothetical protein
VILLSRLKNAGAVLIAKLALGSLAYDDIWFGGQTKNPWNIMEGSTGSSAGPASSTSAGKFSFNFPTRTIILSERGVFQLKLVEKQQSGEAWDMHELVFPG